MKNIVLVIKVVAVRGQ